LLARSAKNRVVDYANSRPPLRHEECEVTQCGVRAQL
jgi:hypothetical protein